MAFVEQKSTENYKIEGSPLDYKNIKVITDVDLPAKDCYSTEILGEELEKNINEWASRYKVPDIAAKELKAIILEGER